MKSRFNKTRASALLGSPGMRPKPASDFPPDEPGSDVRLREPTEKRAIRELPIWERVDLRCKEREWRVSGLGRTIQCELTKCIYHLPRGPESCVLVAVEKHPDGHGYREVGQSIGTCHEQVRNIEKAALRKLGGKAGLLPWGDGRTRLVGPVLGTAAVVLRKIESSGGNTRAELLDWIAGGLQRKRNDVSQAISKLVADGRVTEDEEGALWAN